MKTTSQEFIFTEQCKYVKDIIYNNVRFIPCYIDIEFEYEVKGGDPLPQTDYDSQPEYSEVITTINITEITVGDEDGSNILNMTSNNDLKEIYTIILKESPELYIR